jgi:acetyl-CoA carboxylase biotin carboxyl carrier protein
LAENTAKGDESRDERANASEDCLLDRTLPIGDAEKLTKLVRDSGIAEVRLRQGEVEIVVKAMPDAVIPRTGGRTEPEPVAESIGVVKPLPELNGLHEIRSPLVGTFYRAPTPGEEPYVEVGHRVQAGQTLCIVEAMKLMNEISSDVSGEVVKILAQDAQGVEYDQPLLYLRPKG